MPSVGHTPLRNDSDTGWAGGGCSTSEMASSLPDYDDLPRRSGLPCAWEVWHPEGDRFGCLNLLTEERAAVAARLVERGKAFALNWSMGLPDPPLFGRSAFEHKILARPQGVSQDDELDGWNTQSSTQWDGFRHVKHPIVEQEEPGSGHFGGVENEDHGIDHWAQRGIVGRAILADVGRWLESQGRTLRHDEPDPVTHDDLLACLDAQGTVVEEGDILLIRFGWISWYLEQDRAKREQIADRGQFASSGIHPGEEMVRTLWNLHIAAIAADNPAVEVFPPGSLLDAATLDEVRADPRRVHESFAHTVLLPMLGMPLGEMFFLDDLAADCAADGRYECFFTSAPLNLPRGVASPPNALAIK